MRILSLLPAATEIICALGYKDDLIGRSHECDYPADVQSLPVCTTPNKRLNNSSSQNIDSDIKDLISKGLSIYEVDYELLESLKPDIIITQDHCEVCAVEFSQMEEAVGEALDYQPVIVSVSPKNLDEVLESFVEIAAKMGDTIEGMNLSAHIQKKINAIAQKCTSLHSFDNIFCIEWMDPLLATGNWLPELVQAVNGEALYGTIGEHAQTIDWKSVLDSNPDIIILMPCGFTIDQTLADINVMTSKDGWSTLNAVQNRRVYIADGHHYFNRPGPRLLDSTKILAEMLYPLDFAPHFKNKGWVNLSET